MECGGESGRVLGEIRNYDDLHALLRKRCEELELSCETLDARSGLQSGYSGKLLAPKPIRHLSFFTLGLVLPAVGARLILVEDTDALARWKPAIRAHTGARRAMLAVSRKNGRHAKKPNLISIRFMRRIAKLGGAAYARLPFKTRSRVGMLGAKARWKNGAGHSPG
jgi:hypothetical protein